MPGGGEPQSKGEKQIPFGNDNQKSECNDVAYFSVLAPEVIWATSVCGVDFLTPR
jgi:hypothetical protein